MPLAVVYATHVRVLCDGCQTETAEVYGAKDMPVMATVAAVRKFKSVGWHHDPGRSLRPKLVDDAGKTGWGRWFCPKCGRKAESNAATEASPLRLRFMREDTSTMSIAPRRRKCACGSCIS